MELSRTFPKTDCHDLFFWAKWLEKALAVLDQLNPLSAESGVDVDPYVSQETKEAA